MHPLLAAALLNASIAILPEPSLIGQPVQLSYNLTEDIGTLSSIVGADAEFTIPFLQGFLSIDVGPQSVGYTLHPGRIHYGRSDNVDDFLELSFPSLSPLQIVDFNPQTVIWQSFGATFFTGNSLRLDHDEFLHVVEPNQANVYAVDIIPEPASGLLATLSLAFMLGRRRSRFGCTGAETTSGRP